MSSPDSTIQRFNDSRGDRQTCVEKYVLALYERQELDATIVIAMNSDKKVNGEQGINVLLRDISKILFPNNSASLKVQRASCWICPVYQVLAAIVTSHFAGRSVVRCCG